MSKKKEKIKLTRKDKIIVIIIYVIVAILGVVIYYKQLRSVYEGPVAPPLRYLEELKKLEEHEEFQESEESEEELNTTKQDIQDN